MVLKTLWSCEYGHGIPFDLKNKNKLIYFSPDSADTLKIGSGDWKWKEEVANQGLHKLCA